MIIYRHMRHIKVIKGMIFDDSNLNGIFDNEDKPLKGIKVKLFYIGEIIKNKNNTAAALKEKLILSTRTNNRGEFSFTVPEGNYSLSLDIGSIPEGLGTIKTDILMLAGNHTDNIIYFPLRKVELIETSHNMQKLFAAGDTIELNSIPRDKHGNALIAKVKYSCDSPEVNLNDNILRTNTIPLSYKEYTITSLAGKTKRDFKITISGYSEDKLCAIRNAFNSGLIDESTKISLYLKSILSDERIDMEFDSDQPIKCGASAIKEVFDYIEKSKINTKSTAKSKKPEVVIEATKFITSVVPELDNSYISPSGYFKINYTTEGPHAVQADKKQAVPEYIREVAIAFDYVKKITCDERGFRTPILANGAATMEVNVYNLQGIYGLTIPTKFYPAVPGKQRRASCSISIDNNYSSTKGFKDTPINCMHVTAAHEFFHAVQYAYNVDADSWWKEATATWNEDEIYNEVNDYVRYLDQILSSPEKPLDQSSYGGIIFAKYLSENFGGYSIIKSIWEAQGTTYNTSVAAIDEVIRKKYNKGNDLSTAFKEYTARNYNPSQYYREGHLWKSPVYVENTHVSYPALVENGSLKHLSSSYHLFKSSDKNNNHRIKIILEGSKDIKLGFRIQQRNRVDDLCYIEEIPIDSAYNRAEVILTGLGKTYKEICLIVSNPDKKLDDAKYKYLAIKE